MTPLTFHQIDEGLARVKSLSDNDITETLDEFERRQQRIYKLIFEDLSDSILVINSDMCNLFLDLCFDVIWLYLCYYNEEKVVRKTEFQTLIWKIRLINSGYYINSATDKKLRKEIENSGDIDQPALMAHLQDAVEKYASFKLPRARAVAHTINMLQVIVVVMNRAFDSK